MWDLGGKFFGGGVELIQNLRAVEAFRAGRQGGVLLGGGVVLEGGRRWQGGAVVFSG